MHQRIENVDNLEAENAAPVFCQLFESTRTVFRHASVIDSVFEIYDG